MNKVAIMTDTVTQMPREMADKYDIKLMPQRFTLGGKTYLENEVDLAWFYQQVPKWRETGKLPPCASPSPGDFLEAYRQLSQRAEGILFISVSVKLGAAFTAALQAKKMAEEELPQTPIEVIDCGTVCGAEMLIALEAARAAAAGKSLSEVVEVTHNMMNKVNYIYLSDDLYYMAKGGRIHRARPWAASKVSNTVLLTMSTATGGEHRPIARYRTKGQAVEALFELVKQRNSGQRLHVAIDHANMPAEAEELKQKTLSQFDCLELYVNPILPVVTLHGGLGCRTFSWWGED